MRKLLEVFRQHWPDSFAYVATLALSGLRTGEVAALTWQDVGLDGGAILVNKSYRKGVLGRPKTEASFRSVPIYPRLATVLADHRSGMRKWRLARGLGRPGREEDWVFVNLRGGPIEVGNFRLRIWRAALEKAGVPPLRLHDLRHTYISARIKRGEDLAEVSQQAGHANLRITLKTYAHFIPTQQRDL